jgi:hypothetical protein
MAHAMIPRTVLLLCLAVAADQPTDPPAADSGARPAVNRLLRRLGSGSLEVRDAAERELIGMGPAILPLIAAADCAAWAGRPAPATEAAVRRQGIQLRLEEIAAAQAVEPAVVSLVMKKARPADVLAAVFDQSGSRIAIDPATTRPVEDDRDAPPAPDKPEKPSLISVAFERATFWEAVDDVLAKAGLGIEFSEDAAGLRIVDDTRQPPAEAPQSRGPAVAAGPLRVAVGRIEQTGRPGTAGVRVVLRVAWEPRLEPLLVRLPMQSVVAEGPAGEAMAAAQRAAVVEAKAVGRRQWLDLPLTLTQPTPPLESLGMMRGTVLLWLAGQEHGFEFAGIEAGAEGVAGIPSLRMARAVVTLQRIAVRGDRLLVTAGVTYDEPSEALASHQTWLTKKPLVLVAPDGGTITPLEQTVESRSEQGLTTTAVFLLPGGGRRPTNLQAMRVRWILPIAIHAVPVDFAVRGVSLPPPR